LSNSIIFTAPLSSTHAGTYSSSPRPGWVGFGRAELVCSVDPATGEVTADDRTRLDHADESIASAARREVLAAARDHVGADVRVWIADPPFDVDLGDLADRQ
jgi:hypothetical protein